MAKVKIEELKYIVMEGGGARGTAYLGAVKELEKQLKKLVKDYPVDYKITSVHPNRDGGPGIMDFLKMDYDNSEYKTIIQGVSGGSAGAITTFCILLGLNSTEIEKVLNTDFKKFLSEIDPGKYRMIDSDSNLKVAIDKDGVLGKKAEDFKYDLFKDKMQLQTNTYLSLKRSFLFNLTVKVIGDGLASNIDQLLNMFSKNKSNDMFSAKIQKIFTDYYNVGGKAVKYVMSMTLFKIISEYFLGKLRKKLGMNIQQESLITLFSDNGIFSGFQVREFFYDIILYAATRDTYFQKLMLQYYSKKLFNDKDLSPLFKKNSACFKDFKITERSKTFKKDIDYGIETYEIIDQLQNITFRELWEITGIEFAVAVSNYTAGKPLYFSDIYTPHFRVLEAVASSMNIPPIKPILNASNVFYKTIDKENETTIPKDFFKVNKMSTIDNIEVDFNDKMVKLTENIDAYNSYEHAVKICLREELLLDEILGKPYVDVNNNIDLHTFMPKLMQLVIGDKYDIDTGTLLSKRVNKELTIKTVILNNTPYKITYEILEFYYNAQFKGLLIDGGYYNNIPYNYFRDCVLGSNKKLTDKLDGVIAIKLDNQYPADFITMLNKKYERYFVNIANLEQEIENDLYSTERGLSSELNIEKNKLIELVKIELFQKHLTESNDSQKPIDHKAILNLISAMLKAYKNNQQKKIIL
jgi:predicted acylesterase/phospholipase RssA